jgi:hypothetical protein
MKKLETRLVHKIIDAIHKEYPTAYLRKIHGNPFQHAGIPDIVGCVKGYFIGLEVKTATGRITKIQDLEGLEIIKAKGIYGVVTNETQALEIIKKGLYGN